MSEENKIKVIFRRVNIFKKFLLSGIRLLFSRPYWRNTTIVNLTISALLINVLLLVYIYSNRQEEIYPIILHYNFIFGVDFLGYYKNMYLIYFIGLIILIINSIIGHFLYLREKLASYLLVFSALMVQVFLFIAVYLIVAINN